MIHFQDSGDSAPDAPEAVAVEHLPTGDSPPGPVDPIPDPTAQLIDGFGSMAVVVAIPLNVPK